MNLPSKEDEEMVEEFILTILPVLRAYGQGRIKEVAEMTDIKRDCKD